MTTPEATADLMARIATELADVPRGPIRPDDELALELDGEDDE